MASILAFILGSTVAVSLLSLTGAAVFTLQDAWFQRVLPWLVALSAGSLMGGAFLHLLPQALPRFAAAEPVFLLVLAGFSLFFIVEKYLHWHHCHGETCDVETYAYMNLVGEVVHNFLDGIIIAAAFLTSTEIGIATTLAVALHETPQELGDIGVLLHGGFSRRQALTLNFAVSATAVIGGITGYYLADVFTQLNTMIIPAAAGGFLYIAAADLVPEIRGEDHGLRSVATFTVFLLGIALMYAVKHLPLHG